MNIKQIIPKPPEILREALIVLAGAAIAVVAVNMLPARYKRWFALPTTQDLNNQ